MDTKPDKSNPIILDVYELKNRKPVLTYRINVFDQIILSIYNKGIDHSGAYKVRNEPIKEYLKITPLTPIENLDYNSQLTHSFQIKKLGWKNLYLNLTDNDLIKLGFKEPLPTEIEPNKIWRKTKKLSRITWRVIVGVTIVLGGIAAWLAIRHDLNNKGSKEASSLSKDQPKQNNQNTFHTDSTKISK